MAKKKPKVTKYPRAWHEEFAMSNAKSALKDARMVTGCDPQSVYNLVRAERAVAQARVHVFTIGGSERMSRRTRRIASLVQRADRATDEATNKIARCMIKK